MRQTHRMLQQDLLTSTRLGIAPSIRRSANRDGCVLVRAAGSTQTLVLRSAQASVLTDGFAQATTVPEVLVRLLADNRCPPLNEFYELVLQAP